MGATFGSGSPVMLTIGDSVTWGQGLQDWNKFDRLVCDRLKYRPEYAGLTLARLAHSGAIIGADSDQTGRAAPGEVPWPFPTVIQQCASYDGDPDAVRVVLMNGGINDVSLQVIANPQTTLETLGDLLECYCYRGMLELLKSVAARFSNPACRIIVTGYYQILSAASSFAPTVAFLEILGITEASTLLHTATGFSDLVALSHLFWQGSNTALSKAVDEVNPTVGNRITFVGSGLTEQNSLFQGESLLWVFSGTPPIVDAADDFRDFRAQVCSNFYPDGSVDCAICRFASVGHPTAGGAIKYYEQIMEAFPVSDSAGG